MLFKEVKLALRNLIKEYTFSLVNLAGLTLGTSFSFLILVYVAHQFRYDQHIPDADNIYRIASDFTINGHQDIYANAPRPMGQALVAEFPGITASTKVGGFFGLQVHGGYLKNEEQKYIYSAHLYSADSNFLKVFELPMKQGSKKALHTPNSAIVSQSMAKKLFGVSDPIGKKVTLENDMIVNITGVFEERDSPSYMTYDMIISYTTFYNSMDSERWWYGGHVITYIRTADGFNPNHVYDNWDAFFEKNMKETFDRLNGKAKIILQPLKEVYLDQEYIWEPYPHNSRQNLYIFLAVGIFLFLVAGFNYLNLSLSQSFYRHKAIAIQKILGSGKYMIIRQHLIATMILSFFAGILSISLIGTLIPYFKQMSSSSLDISFIKQPELLLGILGISIACGLLFGVYAAFYESNYQPTDLKKNKNSGKDGKKLIKKVFIVGQQAIAIALIISTLVVIDQINFVKNREIGFDSNNLMIVNLKDASIRKNIDNLLTDLKQIPGIVNFTRADESPETGINEFTLMVQHSGGEFISTPSQTIGVDVAFTNTLKIGLLSGRALKDEDDDYKGVLINFFLARKMGYEPHDAIGAKLKFGSDDEEDRKIVGVIGDFSMGSAQEEAQSMIIGMSTPSTRFLLIRLDEKNQQHTIKQVGKLWETHGSGIPFSYSFMKEDLNELLVKEDTLYHLLRLGTFLIIIISSLGLFGLTSHTATQRTKEMGIRKVIGANKMQLFYSIVKDFLVTLVFAFIIGVGISLYFGHSWLESFTYRVGFDWWNFIVAGLISILTVLLTLSYHSYKLINANPVESLRYE